MIAHETHKDISDATDSRDVCRRTHCLVQPHFWPKNVYSACVKVRLLRFAMDKLTSYTACCLPPADSKESAAGGGRCTKEDPAFQKLPSPFAGLHASWVTEQVDRWLTV